MMLKFLFLASTLLIGSDGKLIVDASNKLLVNASTPSPCVGYYSAVTVNSGQVPSTQTDYPVRIYQTDARFKDVAHSGHVQSSSGFDIRPYSDTGCSSAITEYELAFYDGATGTVEMYVKRSSLADGNVTYLDYGDPSLTTDGSTSTTWSNGFLGVYHLKDGITLSVADSTASNNGTNNGATAAVGQIDGAAGFVAASSQYVILPPGSPTPLLNFVSISAWIKAGSFPNTLNAIVVKDGSVVQGVFAFWVTSAGKLQADIGQTTDNTGTATLSTGTWYHVAAVYSVSGGLNLYLNGSLDKHVADSGGNYVGTNPSWIGEDTPNVARFWDGTIDDVRLSSSARSADWIITEYNEGFPATFETLGSEVSR